MHGMALARAAGAPGSQPPTGYCVNVLLHPLLEGIWPVEHHITLEVRVRRCRGTGVGAAEAQGCQAGDALQSAHAMQGGAARQKACKMGGARRAGQEGAGSSWARLARGQRRLAPSREPAPQRCLALQGSLQLLTTAAPSCTAPHRRNLLVLLGKWGYHHGGDLVHPQIGAAAAQHAQRAAAVFERGARGGATGGREGGSCDGDGGGSAARRQPRTAACSAAWPAQGSCPAPVQQARVAAHLALVPKLPLALLLDLLVPIVGLPRMEGCKSGHVAWAQESCAGMVRRATTCQLAKLHLPSSRSLPGPPATANVSQNRHWNWHRNHNAFSGWPPTLTTRDCHCV